MKNDKELKSLLFTLPNFPIRYWGSLLKHGIRKLSNKSAENTRGEWSLILLRLLNNKLIIYKKTLRRKYSILEEASGLKFILRPFPSSDILVLKQVWSEREYQPALDLLNEKFSFKGKVKIIDGGANVGYTSLYFKKCFPDCEIILIEPAPCNLEIIKRHVAENKLRDIHIKEGGIWHRNTQLRLILPQKEGGEWAFSLEEDIKGKIPGFSIRTILEQMNWNHIDLLKVDIEGSERYLFDNKEEISALLQCVNVLAMEIHPIAGLKEKIEMWLSEFGFDFFYSGELIIAGNTKRYTTQKEKIDNA